MSFMVIVASVVVWTIQHRFLKPELLTAQKASQKVEMLYAGAVESCKKIDDVYVMTLERKGAVYTVKVDAKTGDISALAMISKAKENAELKSEQEIRSFLAKQGVIKTIALNDNTNGPQYVVEVQKAQSLKSIVVDAKTGAILFERVLPLNTNEVASSSLGENTNSNAKGKTTMPANSTSSVSTNLNVSTGVPSNEKSTGTTASTNAHIKANGNVNPTKPVMPTIISQDRAVNIAHSQLKGEVDSVVYEKTKDGGYYLVEIDSEEDEAVFQIHAVSGEVLSITHDNKETKKQKDDEEHED